MKLEMYYPVTNNFVKCCKRKCCNWGQKKTPYDNNNQISSMTTPLWVNPSKTFYKFLFIVTLIMSLLFVGSYIAIQYYNNTLTGLNSTVDSSNTSDEQNNKACVNKAYSYMKSWFIVIGSIILFINSMYNLYIMCIDYASDIEWFRYLIFNSICWLALVGFLIADYLYFADIMNFYQKDPLKIFSKSGTAACRQFFEVNLWSNLVVAIIASIISILQIIKLILLAKKFFFTIYVEHSATCEDEDIQVFQ